MQCFPKLKHNCEMIIQGCKAFPCNLILSIVSQKPCSNSIVEHIGSVDSVRLGIIGLLARDCWQSHCVVFLSKTLYQLLGTGSTQEDRPNMTEKLLTGL